MSMFADKREGVAAALRSGVSLEAVADAEGVSATTIRGWLRRGKREPDGVFGEFLRSAEPSVHDDGPMTVAELERHLTQVIREKKSVAAMVVWLRLHGQDREGVADDPFAEFDPR
jgi:transposase-like protein